MEGYTPGPGGCCRADCFFLGSVVQIRVVSLAFIIKKHEEVFDRYSRCPGLVADSCGTGIYSYC